MKAILIDPWQKSIETIDIRGGSDVMALNELYKLVGEEGIDAAYILPGESIIVGDHSALCDPPLPSYSILTVSQSFGYQGRLYGRGVVIGYSRDGKERETWLSVEDIFKLIRFEY